MLLAGGAWVRSAERARLSVVVCDEWRAHALAAAFGVLGIAEPGTAVERVSAVRGRRAARDGGYSAVTAITADLSGAAARWTRGARQAPPEDFVLGAGGLRLWALAAGRAEESGYLLGTPDVAGAIHRAAGAQLARWGLAAVEVARAPGWRVTSRRRIARLAEVLGEAPPGGADSWPRVP